MILKDIAEKVNMDISTISRVANSKYIDTPYGTKLLKTFFSEGLKNNEKNYSAESYFLAAFIQTEIIRRAFNILSLDTFYLYKTTIQSKIHPIGFPDSHEKIKSLIENVIANKKIQIGVIEPLSFFLGGLIYVGEPNPKLIVNWIDNNVGEVLMNLING